MSSGAAIFVMGPAGSGKSTFCSALVSYCAGLGRMAHLINLDPAAERFEVPPSKGKSCRLAASRCRRL